MQAVLTALQEIAQATSPAAIESAHQQVLEWQHSAEGWNAAQILLQPDLLSGAEATFVRYARQFAGNTLWQKARNQSSQLRELRSLDDIRQLQRALVVAAASSGEDSDTGAYWSTRAAAALDIALLPSLLAHVLREASTDSGDGKKAMTALTTAAALSDELTDSRFALRDVLDEGSVGARMRQEALQLWPSFASFLVQCLRAASALSSADVAAEIVVKVCSAASAWVELEVGAGDFCETQLLQALCGAMTAITPTTSSDTSGSDASGTIAGDDGARTVIKAALTVPLARVVTCAAEVLTRLARSGNGATHARRHEATQLMASALTASAPVYAVLVTSAHCEMDEGTRRWLVAISDAACAVACFDIRLVATSPLPCYQALLRQLCLGLQCAHAGCVAVCEDALELIDALQQVESSMRSAPLNNPAFWADRLDALLAAVPLIEERNFHSDLDDESERRAVWAELARFRAFVQDAARGLFDELRHEFFGIATRRLTQQLQQQSESDLDAALEATLLCWNAVATDCSQTLARNAAARQQLRCHFDVVAQAVARSKTLALAMSTVLGEREASSLLHSKGTLLHDRVAMNDASLTHAPRLLALCVAVSQWAACFGSVALDVSSMWPRVLLAPALLGGLVAGTRALLRGMGDGDPTRLSMLTDMSKALGQLVRTVVDAVALQHNVTMPLNPSLASDASQIVSTLASQFFSSVCAHGDIGLANEEQDEEVLCEAISVLAGMVAALAGDRVGDLGGVATAQQATALVTQMLSLLNGMPSERRVATSLGIGAVVDGLVKANLLPASAAEISVVLQFASQLAEQNEATLTFVSTQIVRRLCDRCGDKATLLACVPPLLQALQGMPCQAVHTTTPVLQAALHVVDDARHLFPQTAEGTRNVRRLFLKFSRVALLHMQTESSVQLAEMCDSFFKFVALVCEAVPPALSQATCPLGDSMDGGESEQRPNDDDAALDLVLRRALSLLLCTCLDGSVSSLPLFGQHPWLREGPRLSWEEHAARATRSALSVATWAHSLSVTLPRYHRTVPVTLQVLLSLLLSEGHVADDVGVTEALGRLAFVLARRGNGDVLNEVLASAVPSLLPSFPATVHGMLCAAFAHVAASGVMHRFKLLARKAAALRRGHVTPQELQDLLLNAVPPTSTPSGSPTVHLEDDVVDLT